MIWRMDKFTPQTLGRIGDPVTRLEDHDLVTGAARFVADINFPGQLYMWVARSQVAHGKIRAIYIAEAEAMPGVVAVWTAANSKNLPKIGFRDSNREDLEPYCQPILADKKVRYIGEPLAVIFAEDPYLAEDAEQVIMADIERLPPVMKADQEPGEFSEGFSTAATQINAGYGDVESAFDTAFKTVSLELEIGRHSGVPMETRGAVARYDSDRDILELHGAAKVPHRNREQIARLLGRDKDSVNLFEYHVGGGFGVRGELYPEDLLACIAAMKLQRPVKWIEDRREHFLATNHSREQIHRIKAAVDSEGVISAIENVFFHDQGAYVRTHGTRVAELSAAMLPGPYLIPNYKVTGYFRLTNKTPAATYRAPGRYETTFVRERLMDAIADALDIDRITVRQRNLIPASAMPFKRPVSALGEVIEYDSGDYSGLLDKALTRFDWHKRQRLIENRRQRGELVGLGIGMFVEKSGLGPTDSVKMAVCPDGKIEVITGGASLGQGFETVIAQICAGTMEVDYDIFRIIHGQTDRIAEGLGAHATRATVMTGSASRIAAEQLKKNILRTAGEKLQLPESELILDRSGIRTVSESGPSISYAKLREVAGPDALCSEGTFYTDHMCYPYGIHLAQISIDPQTAIPKIEQYLIAYDVGRAVNPMLIHGQLIGGFVQGLGGALFEEFRYDEQGEPLSCTFADYLLPTATECPPVEILLAEDAPSPRNPLGLKGAGEGGINAVGATIASAIGDATDMPGKVVCLPLSPIRVRQLISNRISARAQK
jgi:aerobic carbon-monoxide dehydrogenase large subunit